MRSHYSISYVTYSYQTGTNHNDRFLVRPCNGDYKAEFMGGRVALEDWRMGGGELVGWAAAPPHLTTISNDDKSRIKSTIG